MPALLKRSALVFWQSSSTCDARAPSSFPSDSAVPLSCLCGDASMGSLSGTLGAGVPLRCPILHIVQTLFPPSAQGLQQSAVMLKTRNLQTRYLRGIIQTAQPYRFAPPPPALETLHFGCAHDATLQGQTLD